MVLFVFVLKELNLECEVVARQDERDKAFDERILHAMERTSLIRAAVEHTIKDLGV